MLTPAIGWILGTLGAAALITLLAVRQQRARSGAMRELAKESGLTYSRGDPGRIVDTRFELFRREGTGQPRVEDVVAGRRNGRSVRAFAYRHRSGRRSHLYAGGIADADARFPHTAFVSIPPALTFLFRPVLMELDDVAESLGGKRFTVLGDGELARALVGDPGFRAWLLDQSPVWSFELLGGQVFAYRFERVSREERVHLLDKPLELLDRLPRPVLERYRA